LIPDGLEASNSPEIHSTNPAGKNNRYVFLIIHFVIAQKTKYLLGFKDIYENKFCKILTKKNEILTIFWWWQTILLWYTETI